MAILLTGGYAVVELVGGIVSGSLALVSDAGHMATDATALMIALVAQGLMLNWRSWFPGAENSRTIIGGVRAAVYTLMSQLTQE